MSGDTTFVKNLDYKLSYCIYAHSLDVRCLDVLPNGDIVSGSRDKTVKVWGRTEKKQSYEMSSVYQEHSNFVCALCAFPPSTSFPQGLIVTGGSDRKICGFALDNHVSVFTISGHSDTVCYISPALTSGFFSASWDKTAKLWDPTTKKCDVTYSGHTFAVWCVLQLPEGLVVTGSADHTIRIHRPTGEHITTLRGHKDCVRDLCHLRDAEFLSCSNDGAIRRWDTRSQSCLNEVRCHQSYLYSLCCSNDNEMIASSGEDHYVFIKAEENSTHLLLPCQSVWCVKFLPNGDLVTGCSDGVIRIFSVDKSRQADELALQSYEEEVQKMVLKKDVGGIKREDLPGLSALQNPGKKDGELKMINEPRGITCYKWSASSRKWELIGDVTGGVAGDKSSSGKEIYNGKEYDHVFDVDIEDGKPPLKLPYNLTESPYEAAQSFLANNNLSSSFYEQVANFIIQNTSQETKTFRNTDPFTGSSSYTPVDNNSKVSTTGSSNLQLTNNVRSKPSYFPQIGYVSFGGGNIKMIIGKMKEFNKVHYNCSIEDQSLERLSKLVELNFDAKYDYIQDIETVHKIMLWKSEHLYPVLDVIRLAVRHEQLFTLLNLKGVVNMNVLQGLLKKSSPIPNQIMSLRLVSNMFQHRKGRSILQEYKDQLIENILQLNAQDKIKPLEVAVSTFFLNMSVYFQEETCNKKDISTYVSYCGVVLLNIKDEEATFRILVALGSFLNLHKKAPAELPPNVVEHLIMLSSRDQEKGGSYSSERIHDCAEALLSML